MKILISGRAGYMGREVARIAAERGIKVGGGVDPNGADIAPDCAESFALANTDVDCVIDFSHHSSTEELLNFCVENKLPAVVATTGQTAEEKEMIKKASEKIPVFFAANYSVGVALLCALAKKTAEVFPDAEIEIIEKHHNRKLDAPSGTAIAIADAIGEVKDINPVFGRSGHGKREKKDVGIHAVRMGNIVGEHEVLVNTGSQMITLKHEAFDRGLFAEGALSAAAFLVGKGAGLYSMKDLIIL